MGEIVRRIRATLNGRSGITRLAAVFAVMLTALTFSGTPALAGPTQRSCGILGGSVTAKTHIELCVEMAWGVGGHDFQTRSYVEFGERLETSATACKVTVYLELKANGDPWTSGRNSQDCSTVIYLRDTLDMYTHFSSDTSATSWRGHACIDLYYNHSSSSGWQRCHVSAWRARPSGV